MATAALAAGRRARRRPAAVMVTRPGTGPAASGGEGTRDVDQKELVVLLEELDAVATKAEAGVREASR